MQAWFDSIGQCDVLKNTTFILISIYIFDI